MRYTRAHARYAMDNPARVDNDNRCRGRLQLRPIDAVVLVERHLAECTRALSASFSGHDT